MICCLSASVLSQKESQGYLGSDCVAIQTHRGKLISHTHYGDPTSAPAPAPTTSAIAATLLLRSAATATTSSTSNSPTNFTSLLLPPDDSYLYYYRNE